MRSHLFPCRTQKLSSSSLKILGWQRPGNIGRRRHNTYSSIAQLVEHAAVNRRVVGSSPTGGAKKVRRYDTYGLFHFVFYLFCQANLLGFFHFQGFLIYFSAHCIPKNDADIFDVAL